MHFRRLALTEVSYSSESGSNSYQLIETAETRPGQTDCLDLAEYLVSGYISVGINSPIYNNIFLSATFHPSVY
jgi:hypothetical protein